LTPRICRIPDPPEGAADRDALILARMQAWCDLFEAHLLRHPEDWLFWLDKKWSRMLRSTERKAP
jgi:lauroyl/myristoyl acyltransferase